MRDLVRWVLRNWLLRTLLVVGVILGIYALSEWAFGPYRHWTLSVRGPIATVVTAGFLWPYVVGQLWRGRSGWWN